MPLKEDLESEVKSTLKSRWDEEKAEVVPAPDNLRLNSNHAKCLESATVLYADLDGSTNMVDNYKWWFAAEVYKSYLRCASRIINSEGGSITAYDGDRVMAVFVGGSKNTTAVRTALKINYAVEEIIRPAIKAQYSDTDFLLKHVIGVDTSVLRVARVGVRGDNDLVWIGCAANHAARLCNLSEKPLWITEDVYNNMNENVKTSNGSAMWQARSWTQMGGKSIYCSTYRWKIT